MNALTKIQIEGKLLRARFFGKDDYASLFLCVFTTEAAPSSDPSANNRSKIYYITLYGDQATAMKAKAVKDDFVKINCQVAPKNIGENPLNFSSPEFIEILPV